MPAVTICVDWASRVVGLVGLFFAVFTLVYVHTSRR